MIKLTYEQLEVRCELYRAAAEINHDTVIAQQRAYNEHITKIEDRLFALLRELNARNARATRRRK